MRGRGDTISTSRTLLQSFDDDPDDNANGRARTGANGTRHHRARFPDWRTSAHVSERHADGLNSASSSSAGVGGSRKVRSPALTGSSCGDYRDDALSLPLRCVPSRNVWSASKPSHARGELSSQTNKCATAVNVGLFDTNGHGDPIGGAATSQR